MVSPQSNPNPTVGQSVTTGRGFVTPEEAQAGIYQPQPVLARSRISWGAVIAGSLLTISILALSGSLAYACGVPAFSGGPYGWGAGIWSIITAAIAFYAGGCVAAYLAGSTDTTHNMLHGVMTWALAIPLVMVLFAGVHGVFAQGGLMASDVTRMVVSGNPQATVNPAITAQSAVDRMPNLHLTGAAWGAFLSLAVGLIFAAIGGSSVMGDRFMGDRLMGRRAS